MARLIDPEALLTAKFPEEEDVYQMGWNDALAAAFCEAPTVDAAPVVHARWEQYPDSKHMRCSNCKVERQFDHTMLFCPHCGATMDGGNEDGR